MRSLFTHVTRSCSYTCYITALVTAEHITITYRLKLYAIFSAFGNGQENTLGPGGLLVK